MSSKVDSVVVIVSRIVGLCLVLVLLLWSTEARAGQLADRLAQFPNWESKPPVTSAKGDLVYPDWMEGTWKVTSTLVELVAPLAPDVVTPGFEGNRRYLNQPINFLVRFNAVNPQPSWNADRILQVLPLKIHNWARSPFSRPEKTTVVVADRAFNGLNIAQAYLSDRTIQAVKVDPNSPNRQITFLRQGLQLISQVTGRASETPAPDQFIATEVTNQFFRGTLKPHFNQVETTTAYQLKRSEISSTADTGSPLTSPLERRHGLAALALSPTLAIEAEQITAIYLSPQDVDYFKALDRPVALYRYRLELQPLN